MRLRVLQGAAGSMHAQSGLAVAEDGQAPWLLLNVSAGAADRIRGRAARTGPADVGHASGQPTQPSRRQAPGQAVVMTDAQLDQVAGLISLRGAEDVHLYATPAVFEEITQTMASLHPACRPEVHWHLLAIAGDQQVVAFQVPGQEGLEFTAFDAALLLPGVQLAGDMRPTGERIAIGMRDRGSGKRALYLRGPAAPALQIAGALEDVHCLVLDPGSFSDEGVYESMADWLAALPIPRKLLLKPLDAAGWPGAGWPGVEVPVDGCDIEL